MQCSYPVVFFAKWLPKFESQPEKNRVAYKKNVSSSRSLFLFAGVAGSYDPMYTESSTISEVSEMAVV